MFRLSPPRSDINSCYLNSVYLQTIVSQGWKRYETDFEELEILNSGEFYSVVKVINKIDSQIYAIKKIQIQLSNEQQIEINLQRVLKEVKYLALLNHPYIMRYYNSWIQLNDQNYEQPICNKFLFNEQQSPLKSTKEEYFQHKSSKERISYSEAAESNSSNSQNTVSDKNLSPKQKRMSPWIISRSCGKKFKKTDKINIFIQTEYCDQSLQNYLNNNQLDIKNSIQISLKIISALEYIHQECKLVHRDLRPDNIFINNQNDVRIGDFGLMRKIKKLLVSKQFSQFGFVDDSEFVKVTTDCSQFQAPELQDNNPNKLYDNRIDIYSFGLILLLLFLPRMSINEQKKMLYEARIYYYIPNELWKNNKLIAEIIEKCLSQDPNQRCSLQQIKETLGILQDGKYNEEDYNEQILGILDVQLEDEDVKIKRYLRKCGYQLLIHKSREHKKAIGCYDLRQCNMKIEGEKVKIEHEELMSLWIDCQDQQEMKRLMDQLLQK